MRLWVDVSGEGNRTDGGDEMGGFGKEWGSLRGGVIKEWGGRKQETGSG